MARRTFFHSVALTAFAIVFGSARPSAAQVPMARPGARQVAAPAGDILTGLVRLPDPASTPTVSSAAILPVRFERARGVGWAAELSYPVEHGGTLVLALLSPAAANWRVLAGPVGAPLRPIDEAYALERRTGLAGDALPGWVVDRRDVLGVAAGTWLVRIEAGDSGAPADGWLLASASGDLRAEAFVTTQRLVAGAPIGIAARVRGHEAFGIERAQVVLECESDARELELHDDGAHDDNTAGDGLFGALVPEDLLGRVRARVELTGTTRTGRRFLRSTQVAFTVLEPRLLLDGTAASVLLDERRLAIAIGALPQGSEQRLHVSAEVWGRDAAGEAVPVCWLSRMLEPPLETPLEPPLEFPLEFIGRGGRWELPLVLDLDWLDVAGARAPLELREVRVQDPDTEVVYDLAERIELATPPLPAPRASETRAITARMLTGGSQGTIGMSAPFPPVSDIPLVPALLLVHGYCSGGTIWPAADFTQPKLEFQDPSANRSHDQFAQLLSQQAALANITSFGVVAHSQGGAAALHLLTYYSSGLDYASGGRRIQSVASPYQGTPLASLGFFACGVNNDMTPAGAATWLAGIPSWARAEVHTWTTSNTGAACNFLTNLLLMDPEDGTVEKFRGELPGGNNMGHVTGWCHTTGMSNPANYTDHARNQAMDAAAAR